MKEITIKIEGAEWEKAIDAAFEKANKTAKIDGFRPGKAPKDVFLKKYGVESLYMEAADTAMQLAYVRMLNENKDLEIIAQPEADIKRLDENGAEFIFKLTLKPEVKLGKYKNLGIKKDAMVASDEEVEHSISHLLEKYAEISVKDGAIEKGDTVIFDFEGFKDGVAFDGGKAENYSLVIGSGQFIPGFEDAMIGMKKDEEKEINLTFPADYHSEDLKGADVVFKVKVNEIKESKIPEMNEEFFADLGMEGIDSKEALEKETRANIIAGKEAESENKYIDELLAKAAETTEVEIPEVLIDEETTRMLGQYGETLKMQGLSLEQYYQFTNSTEADLKEQMKEEANRRVKYRFMLEAIVSAENIEVTDEEAKAEAKKLSEKYNLTEEEFLKHFGGTEMIAYDLKMRKAIEIIKA